MAQPQTTTQDQVHELFTAHGLRCTRRRRAIYEALAASHKHPTTDQLYRQVADSVNWLSLATVYNTLEAFCREGLAQRVFGNGGSSRYDTTVHDHLHLRCERTGDLCDVPQHIGQQLLDRIPPDVIQQIESKLGFKVRHVQIELIGEYLPEKPR